MRKLTILTPTLLAILWVFVVVFNISAQSEEGEGIGHYEEESTPNEPHEADAIWNIAWSPDGSKIAYAFGSNTSQCNLSNNDYSVHILDANTYAEIGNLAGQNMCPAMELEWSPDGTLMLLANTEYAIIWDVNTGQAVSSINTAVMLDPFVDHEWSPDGSKIASLSSANYLVRVWDPLTGIETNSFNMQGDYAVALSWNPNGIQLALASSTIEIWDISTGTQVQPIFTSSAADVSWSPDGSKIAAVLSTNDIRIFDATTGNLMNTLIGHSSTISEVVWRNDSRILASSSLDSIVIVWDAVAGTVLETFTNSGTGYTLDWNPDGQEITFSSANSDGSSSTVNIEVPEISCTMTSMNVVTSNTAELNSAIQHRFTLHRLSCE